MPRIRGDSGWPWPTLVLFTSVTRVSVAYQYVSDQTCNFTFSTGDWPTFHLPEAGPNSPGDTILNEFNPVVAAPNTSAPLYGCNGESSSYLVGNDTWNTTFFASGLEYDIDIFYATYDDQLWVRTIQLYMDPSLYDVLNNTIIRLNVTCTDYGNSCLEFKANFSEQSFYNYSAPYPFNDSCFHGFATGERVPVVRVPAAYPEGPSEASSLSPNVTIISAGGVDMGLPWSEAFEEDGDEKDDDEYWGPWWGKTHQKHGGGSRDSSDDSDDDDRRGRRRLELSAESDCQGDYSEYWNVRTGRWADSFTTLEGESHPIDMFFMNEVEDKNELWVESIESWMAPSLYNQLQFTYVRLNLTCPSSTKQNSCIIFQPRFTNWSPEIDGGDAGYRFYEPALPAVGIPDAQPNSPGDIRIVDDNHVVTKTGSNTETYCNGDQAQFYGEDGYWHRNFIGSDGNTRALDHLFFMLNAYELWSATIQSVWAPNVEELLTNRTVRMRIWCTNDEAAQWLFFRVGGEAAGCNEIPGLCENATDGSGVARAMPNFGHFLASAAISILMSLVTVWCGSRV